MFIDKIHTRVQAGRGGNGCESYFRRTDKKQVPDGGDGGRGGSVIFRADTNAPSLRSFRYQQHIMAESGGHGGSSRKRGKNGKDLEVLVPLGTRLYDAKRNFLIRDLVKEGDEVLVLEGGRGGTGNAGGKRATRGEKGEALELELTFRIMADVFFVGIPNSGKSTLLNSLTGTRLGEKDYPFSTRTPEIGVHALPDYEHVTLCELPSLYGASHEGRGMGSDFLKHLEKAKLILHVLDPVSKFSSSLTEGLGILRKEMEAFDPVFLQIPFAVVVNKMDLPEAAQKVKEEKFEPGAPCFFISALTGEGMPALEEFLKIKNQEFQKV
ncbi:MAG TPA: GTPase [bacterium]|nr:GTPase [bacterium]